MKQLNQKVLFTDVMFVRYTCCLKVYDTLDHQNVLYTNVILCTVKYSWY